MSGSQSKGKLSLPLRSNSGSGLKDHPPNPFSAGGGGGHNDGESLKARIFLFVACFWPFWVLALFAASASNQDRSTKQVVMDAAKEIVNPVNIRNILDRVDVMGYGPTHPRLGIVVVASDHGGDGNGEAAEIGVDETESLVSTVESIYRNTDLNRVFVICVVVDGKKENPDLVSRLQQIDAGSVPHWHGLRPDIHMPGTGDQSNNKDEDDEDPHGRKIHVMFNERREGISASRQDAAEFIQLLAEKHEAAGFKSPIEDLILLLLQSGAQLADHKWLAPVTSALIVPPPLLGKHDPSVALKLANAVSFQIEGPGKRTSFDEKLAPVTSDATASDINMSSGRSYSTPAVNGAAIALRLETFLSLPAQDPTLMDPWPANLELSLNLWLCADGIDIISDVEVMKPMEATPMVPLEPELAARFAAAWMDEQFAQRFFQAYSTTITRLEWETLAAKARDSNTFPKDLAQRCRSFQWFAGEINSDLSKVLEQVIPEEEDADEGHQHKTIVRAITPESQAKAADSQPKQIKEQQPEVKENVDPVKKIEKDTDILEMEPLAVGDEQQDQQQDEDQIPNLVQNHHQKPSKPLCDECLEIVQKAQPIDISFVDVSKGNREFPHEGARDENGNWGYVHDETALHKNRPPFNFEEAKMKEACVKRDNTWRMLTEQVFVDTAYDAEKEKSGAKRDKIFCLVYTIESGHVKIPNIRETWGPNCDGFMVGSNKTDVSLGTVDIPHEGPEEYNNIWQKVRSMWSYIYDNYYEKYDWFHIGGDDLYLIVENLRYYLESEEIRTASNGGIYLPDGTETTQTPLYLGRRFSYMGDMNDIFNSGGSGYTMNKAALKALVVDGFPNYFPHAHTFSEDTMVAKVFRKMGVYPYETKDENGSERYMPFQPGHHYGYRLPADKKKDWYAMYSIDIKEGKEHCSPRSVAFHYIKGDMMKRLHAMLYHLCPEEYLKI